MNKKSLNKFSSEVRERAVCLVREHCGEYPLLWAAAESITPKIGCSPPTLLKWVRDDEIDSGFRAGVSTEESERIKAQERKTRSRTGSTRF